MKPLGLLQSTLQILAIIIAGPLEYICGASKVEGYPEGGLHFLSVQKWRGNIFWPKALEMVHRGPEIALYSQCGTDRDSLCAFQLANLSGVVRTRKMDKRSSPLWPASPLIPVWSGRSAGQRGLEHAVCLSLECTPPWERNHKGIDRPGPLPSHGLERSPWDSLWQPCLAGS